MLMFTDLTFLLLGSVSAHAANNAKQTMNFILENFIYTYFYLKNSYMLYCNADNGCTRNRGPLLNLGSIQFFWGLCVNFLGMI